MHIFNYIVNNPEGPRRNIIEYKNDLNMWHSNAIHNKPHVRGVKGDTLLNKLKYFDITKSIQIDYMHSVLLGVIKTFFSFWFDNNNEKYSLSKHIKQIDDRLLKLRPPSYITIAPRTIATWKQWKAREFLNFILFYSLIVFRGLMKHDAYNNIIKLVLALEILLSKNINLISLSRAKLLLREFVSELANLYSDCIMKSGVHELLHLVDSTIEIGPLNALSCFPFEELNRKMLRLVKGHDLIAEEFYKLYTVAKLLSIYISELSFNSIYSNKDNKLYNYINNNFKIKSSNRKLLVLRNDFYNLSLNIRANEEREWYKHLKLNKNDNIISYDRLCFNGIVFMIANNKTKFDNSAIETVEGKFGLINDIAIVNNNKAFFYCKSLIKIHDPFVYTNRNFTLQSSCYMCTLDHNTYFVCELEKTKKVAFFYLNEFSIFLNSFQINHLFS